jgi:hypothetical protein
VLVVKDAEGVNVAVLPLYVTNPETGVVPPISVNELFVTVTGFIGVLKVAVMALSSATA